MLRRLGKEKGGAGDGGEDCDLNCQEFGKGDV